MHILIVEDEQHIADGLRFNIEAEGYDAKIVGDGDSGWPRPNKAASTLLCSTSCCPGIDGFEVAAALRARHDYTPI